MLGLAAARGLHNVKSLNPSGTNRLLNKLHRDYNPHDDKEAIAPEEESI